MKGYSTTKEAAQRLGVSMARIRQMIIGGAIKAEKVGRDNFITERELTRVERLERKPGRPRKGKK